MAEALEQAVETVEPDSDATPSPAEGGGTDAPIAELLETPEPPADDATSKHPPSTLKERYLVFPAMPLVDFNSPTAMAYGVEDRREPTRNLFALVCSPVLPAATKTMLKLRNANISGLIPLIDYGPVFWSPSGQRCMVIIFERPKGGRFLDAFENKSPLISEYDIGSKFIERLLPALLRFAAMGIGHRGFRLDNLYYMDDERQDLVLGECVTAPPGHDQPMIYESLESAMTMPSARGAGTVTEDLYAFGICTVFLLLGKNPIKKYNDEDMITKKSDLGSYTFLCGNERIPLQLIELIRGVLADDPTERWELDSISRWIEGQKPHIVNRKVLVKAKGPFEFMGREFFSPRSIAYAFSKNIPDAIKIINTGKLETWLRKSFDNAELGDGISALITLRKVHEGKPEASDDVFISRVCMRIDPNAPIRFKGFVFTPDGFGDAFATEFLRKGSFQVQGEVLSRDLIGYWASVQEQQSSVVTGIVKTFNSVRSFSKINEMGFGMERSLYELNRSLPCQGELLQHHYVSEMDDLLPALDSISDEADPKTRPIDKHIAAFVATHFSQDVHPHLKALSNPTEENSLIGLLSLYALIQWRQGHETLFGLSSWVGGLLQPAISTYHSRTTQQTIEQEIPALVRQGSLPGLFDLIDNSERRHSDSLAFKQAQYQFSNAEGEIQSLVGEEVDQEQVALESGEKATSMFSVVLCMVGITITIFVMMF